MVRGSFFGREGELKSLMGLLEEKRGVAVVVGESGMGKSTLLEALREELKGSEKLLIGWCEVDRSVSTIYPFAAVLGSLLAWIYENEPVKAKIKVNLERIGKALKNVVVEEATGVAMALVNDAIGMVERRAPEMVNFMRKVVKESKKVSAVSLADEFVSQHRQELIYSYLGIFEALLNEFKDKKLVLIFDQFESVTGKASVDFLLDFVKRRPAGIYVVVSFKTEADKKRLFEDAKTEFKELGAEVIELSGLDEDDIGEWVKAKRRVDLPYPVLKRVRKFSGGFPILLKAWISESKGLNPDELDRGDKRETLYEYFSKRLDGLGRDDCIRLNQLSVLLRPLPIGDLAELVSMIPQMNRFTPEMFAEFAKDMVRRDLFRKLEDAVWFKHELIQRCIEDGLGDTIAVEYHRRAADFFAKRSEKIDYEAGLGLAYHFHHSRQHKQSYEYNMSFASFAFKVSDFDVAEECYLRAIRDAEELKSQGNMMVAKSNLANVYRVWGRLDDAMKINQDALEYFKTIGDEANQSKNLHNIAVIHQDRGEYDEALKLYNGSLEIERRLGDQSGVSYTLRNIAVIHQAKGEYDEALKLYNGSLEINRRLGDQSGVSSTLHNIAMIHQRKGEYDEALKLYNESLEINRRLGDQSGVSKTLHQIANVNYVKGEYDEALKLYNGSLEIKRRLGDQSGVSATLHQIAMIHQDRGEYDEALKLYNQSLEIERRLGDQLGMAITLGALGRLHIEKKNYREAIPFTITAYNILKRLKAPEVNIVVGDLQKIISEIGEAEYKRILEDLDRETRRA